MLKYHTAYAEDLLSHCPNTRRQIFIELYKTENLFADLQFCLNSHPKNLGISERLLFSIKYFFDKSHQLLIIKNAVQVTHFT